MSAIPNQKRKNAAKWIVGWLICATIFVLVSISINRVAFAEAPQFGSLKGVVLDKENNSQLIGATVYLVGTELGMACDESGAYDFRRIPIGMYSVEFSQIGYKSTTVDSVIIRAGEVTEVRVKLEVDVAQVEGVVIEERALLNTASALQQQRKKSETIVNSISAEEITKSGSGNAAEAMTKVTGATLVDGRQVYVRGLGDRYTNATMNGIRLPSSNPDAQSAPLDLVGSGMLDKIVVQKTFTPDKPGDFTGGSVDLGTRDYPDQRLLTFSSSTKYNSMSSFNDDFLSYIGGSKDWLGYDDGTRSIPTSVTNFGGPLPTPNNVINDTAKINQMSALNRSFNPQLTADKKSPPINQSYSVTYGDRLELAENPLGVLATFSYSRNTDYYDDGIRRDWQGNIQDTSLSQLIIEDDLNVTSATDEVFWGGMGTLTYEAGAGQKFKANVIYNRSAEDKSMSFIGTRPKDLGETRTLESFVLHYTERDLFNLQGFGDHLLYGKDESGWKLNWMAGYAKTIQEEPDRRELAYDWGEFVRRGDTFLEYKVSQSNYSAPRRIYSNLEESNRDLQADLTKTFKLNDAQGRFKLGVANLDKSRTSRQSRFYMGSSIGSAIRFVTSPDSAYFFPQEYFDRYLGDTLSTDNRYTGLYWYNTPLNDSLYSYDGTQEISASYAMLSFPVSQKLSIIGGARYETTKMNVKPLYFPATPDSSIYIAELDEQDILPALSLLYRATSDMNFRASFGRTLARPAIHELSPVTIEGHAADFQEKGNPKLDRSLIDNYDLRWEWFPSTGELVSVSAFYKSFENAIECVIREPNAYKTWNNVDHARVRGIELELRKKFVRSTIPILRSLSVGGNLTLMSSEVQLDSAELAIRKGIDPTASDTRQLQGQSDYVINLDLAYDNDKTGTSLAIYYNVFGERLAAASLGKTPDIYEKPVHDVDVTFYQRIFTDLKLKGGVMNVLGSDYKEVHHFAGQEYIKEYYSRPTVVAVGLTYSL